MKVDLICETCGVGYRRTPHVANYSRFCSAKCRIVAVSQARRRPLAERFWEKVDRREVDECWPWTGGTFADGYGAISVDGKPQRAPRVSVMLDGRKPGRKHVRHKCDNPICVNPGHLLLGTAADNAKDKVERNRQSRNCKVTDEQVVEIRSSTKPFHDIAAEYGISGGLVSLIRGKRPYRNNGAAGKSVRTSTKRGTVPRETV